MRSRCPSCLSVYDGSKMKNFKQFTTFNTFQNMLLKVCMMVQRWRISSNSQLPRFLTMPLLKCVWWFKDEEFQAIHNMHSYSEKRTASVYDGSKMKNFKQFTTTDQSVGGRGGCVWWFKDEEFQAILWWFPKCQRARKKVVIIFFRHKGKHKLEKWRKIWEEISANHWFIRIRRLALFINSKEMMNQWP